MSAYQHVAHLPFNHLLEKINSSTNVKKLFFFSQQSSQQPPVFTANHKASHNAHRSVLNNTVHSFIRSCITIYTNTVSLELTSC